ncbi:hypothetical protein QU661_01010 [Mogibacterium neglectum]|uniref:hypothetical protein n=1 Tax=Mogibacterium neglectum TaxID=114528 RepID=UPI00272B4B50|nr:hypothetical protein [Mogibacterium neglectum]WLD76453.1 hypothetical protein QU661_01010 [Mogibacterium neglectum]
MRQKRNIVLIILAMIMVLSLSSCGQSSGDVKTFVKKVKEIKNLEYETIVYRRYIVSNGATKGFKGETRIRQGKIQLDPQIFSEYYMGGSSQSYDVETTEKSLLRFGSTDYLNIDYKVYSPNPKEVYAATKLSSKNYAWEWKKSKEISSPELGIKTSFLDVYEHYADKFKQTEDDYYFYLDYKGDVTKNLNQIGKMQRAIIPKSNFFTKGKSAIQSCKLEIHLVMKKGKGGPTPCEAKIKITTKLKDASSGVTVDNEDNFQAFYRDINEVNKIKKPYGFDASNVKKS